MKQKEEKLNIVNITCEYTVSNSKKKYTEELSLTETSKTKSYKILEESDNWNDVSIRILVDLSEKRFAWIKSGKSIAELTKRPVKYEESLEALLSKFYHSELNMEDEETFASFKISKMELKSVSVVSTLKVNSITSDDLITVDISNNEFFNSDYLNDVMVELESMKEPKQKKPAKRLVETYE